METRPYFIVGDIVSNLFVGALVGGACALLLDTGWNMFVAMIVGMVLGMVISLPLALLLSAFFGAMETILPVMTTGMVAGMVISMAASLVALRAADAAWLGCFSGLGVVVATGRSNPGRSDGRRNAYEMGPGGSHLRLAGQLRPGETLGAVETRAVFKHG